MTRRGRTVLRFAALVGATCGCLAGVTAAPGGSSRTGGRASTARAAGLLAFESYDRNGQIVTMRPDGTGGRVVVRNAREPAWSPDGRWLAYTRAPDTGRSQAIMRVRSNGTQARVVSRWKSSGPPTAHYASHASWSPDGRRIVFSANYGPRSSDDLNSGVFVAARDGSRPRRVWADTGLVVGSAWSSDGRRIALRTAGGSVGLVPARGGRLHVLSRGHQEITHMQFSPEGGRLLVVELARSPLQFIDVRTGRRTVIRLAEGELLGSATWTPDGKRIAYMAQLGWTPEGGVPPGASTALFTIRPDGTAKRRLMTVPTQVQGTNLGFGQGGGLSWKATAPRG